MNDNSAFPWHLRVIKGCLGFWVRRLFRVRVRGIENLTEAGERRILMVNHQSYIDSLLLVTLLPGRVDFAINHFTSMRWWVRPWLWFVHVYRVDNTKPYATNTLIKDLRKGNKTVVIFPEGRLTTTSHLMKTYYGAAMVVDKTDVPVVPIHIEGAQYSFFSLVKGKVRRRWFPRIAMTIHPPRRLSLDEDLSGRQRRHVAGTWLYDVMCDTQLRSKNRQRTIFEALLDARKQHGGRMKIIEDITWKSHSYNQIITGAIVLGRHLTRYTQLSEGVGMMLPNVTGAVVVWMALQAIGRVPTLLNYTSGSAVLLTVCRMAHVHTVLTARRFIKQAHLETHVQTLETEVTILYLEDLQKTISLKEKLIGVWIARWSAGAMRKWFPRTATDPAVILFTSGSEGSPKGVVLSHRNLLTNIEQVVTCIDFTAADKILNVLPIFHSFGLTCGMVMPLLLGVRLFLYVSPLHHKLIPSIAYHSNATIFFGADTFLATIGRHAHASDFYAMRYVIAGAEALRSQTWQMWADRFGIRILQGYGVTETAPVIAFNTPVYHRMGTVGRLVPGIDIRLEAIDGISHGGRLLVKGDNVMLGYLNVDQSGIIDPPNEGWHDTGDIVTLEQGGYLRIIGRVKRFAKIGGEMVSLVGVEEVIAELYPDSHHAVLAQHDERKGEQLVLITTHTDMARTTLGEQIQKRGWSPLFVPRQILTVDAIPLLATGKVDYSSLKELLLSNQSTRKSDFIV